METVVSVFRGAPALQLQDGMIVMPSRKWFDDIAKQIAQQTKKCTIQDRDFGKALIAGKTALPITRENGTILSFESLYTKIMLMYSSWTYPEFPALLESLLKIRKEIKHDDVETSIKIKAWVNMLYGQLHDGTVRCNGLTPAKISSFGRNIMQQLLSHETAFYCDTDECYFATQDVDKIKEHVRKVLVKNGCDPEKFTYSLTRFNRVTVHNLKKVSISFDK
jgi:hypothetical protein